MADDTLLLWVDVETTGLNPAGDHVLEVGAILTGPDLDELAQFERLVWPGLRARWRLSRTPQVRDMHNRSGLLDQCRRWDVRSVLAHTAATELEQWLDAATSSVPGGQAATIHPAGYSVHFDVEFGRRFCPAVFGGDAAGGRLHHRCYDVSALNLATKLSGGPDIKARLDDQRGRPHRALADCRHAIEAARRLTAPLAFGAAAQADAAAAEGTA